MVQADGVLAREERVAAVRRQMQEEIMKKMQEDRSSGAVERVKADAEAKARLFLIPNDDRTAVSTCCALFGCASHMPNTSFLLHRPASGGPLSFNLLSNVH